MPVLLEEILFTPLYFTKKITPEFIPAPVDFWTGGLNRMRSFVKSSEY